MSKTRFQGKITNLDTGERAPMDFSVFINDVSLKVIIQVEECTAYDLPDETIQVYADCLALDSVGGVFMVGLNYQDVTQDRRDVLAAALQPGAVYVASGPCTVGSPCSS